MTITKADLVLIRSDEGDGGWSLHSSEQIAIAKKHGDAPAYLNAGPADLLDEATETWSRPDAQDYADAIGMLEGEE